MSILETEFWGKRLAPPSTFVSRLLAASRWKLRPSSRHGEALCKIGSSSPPCTVRALPASVPHTIARRAVCALQKACSDARLQDLRAAFPGAAARSESLPTKSAPVTYSLSTLYRWEKQHQPVSTRPHTVRRQSARRSSSSPSSGLASNTRCGAGPRSQPWSGAKAARPPGASWKAS